MIACLGMKELAKLVAILAVISLAISLWGQEPLPTRLETDQVRVVLATEQPHRRGQMHEHATNRVQIYLNDGVTTLTRPDGRVDKVEYKAGDVRWSPAGGQHISENITDRPVRIVEIELKGKPQPGRKVSNLDPVKVDP